MATDTQILFQRRAEELLRSLRTDLSAADIDGVQQSINEGDHAEAIRTLAWIIEKKEGTVPHSSKLKICELSRSLVDFRDMPESFRGILLEETEA